ncbi:MAG TPA: hypothetical protein VFG86_05275 [Chloroflexota bacterium]|nr:hypothetical protein [Chloroflexota bacterium]
MDAAAPDAAEPPDKSETTGETRKRSWPRLKIPTGVIVTLLGIALTAWLLPAFTRQWDDRQKERELKTVLATDMATATAKALVGGEKIWSQRSPHNQRAASQQITPQQRTELADDWARAQLEIEARLRSYFSAEAVTSWELYAWMVDRFIDGHRVSAAAALRDVVRGEVRLDPPVADAAANVLALGRGVVGPRPIFDGDSPVEKQEVSELRQLLKPYMSTYGPVPSTWRPYEKLLMLVEQAVADQVVADHAAGYSTTTRNLIHDLLPF